MTTIVAGLDIESTGLDFRANHKIIEIAITRYELETQKHIDSTAMRFNPRRSIDPKAGSAWHFAGRSFRRATIV